MIALADTTLKADFDRIAHHRILFGHQSVGTNILEGVAQLAKTAGVPIRIAEVPTAAAVGAKTFGHVYVSENGKPRKKIESFELAMGQESGGIDIALVKFCYVDFASDTDASALFAEYRTSIDRLKSRHPGTTFIHITAPLTTVQDGTKAWMKRLLGRPPHGLLENIRRNEYNELIRKAYSGREPIFDLAHVESTTEDGRQVTVDWQGQRVPALGGQYSEDGGHLNTLGRLRTARELVSILSAVMSNRQETKITR